MSRPPVLKPFTLALIQLGGIGADKSANLQHASDMIRKAASAIKKPDLIVLPVRSLIVQSKFTPDRMLGMLQFAIRSCSFSGVCREHRIHSWTAV